MNNIKTWEERYKHGVQSTWSPTPITEAMLAEIAELRARIESLAADAERWKSALHKKAAEELAEKEAYSFTVPEIMDATRRYGYSMTNSEVLEALAKEKA
jgi:hypothetical protein